MNSSKGGNPEAAPAAGAPRPVDETRVDPGLSDEVIRRRAQLRAVLDAIPDHVCAKDVDGVYWLCNQAFSEHIGREPRDVIGRTDAEIFGEDEARRRTELDHIVLAERKTLRSESWERSRGGGERLYDTFEAPFYNLEGELLGLIEVSRDITARHRAQEELREARDRIEEQYDQLKALEALRDSLTHMIVHDMRSPLTGIAASLQILEMDADQLDESAAEDLRRAARNATLLTQMITGVLDVSKMEAGEMQLDVDEHDLVESAGAALDSLGGLTADRDLAVEANGPVRARYDEGLITRVVANLVSNALRFTPVEGSVRVATMRADGAVRVEVRDTGPGIPLDQQHRVFDKFARVDSGGDQSAVKFSTGLGLAFCRLAVEAHGGSIGVLSTQDEGSTFWFELPAEGPS